MLAKVYSRGIFSQQAGVGPMTYVLTASTACWHVIKIKKRPRANTLERSLLFQHTRDGRDPSPIFHYTDKITEVWT